MSEQASRGYEYRSLTDAIRVASDVYRQSFDRGMRLVSKTNTQKPSGQTRLYYKAFAETRSCLPCAPYA